MTKETVDHNRSKTYQIINEVFNATTHGIATVLALVAFVLLMEKGLESGSTIEIVAFAIYGSMLVLLFLFSTLAHSLHFTRATKVFQVFDHSGIFLLIAGSYTPYCLIVLNNWLGWLILFIIWLCAILGIIFTAIYLPKRNSVPRFSTFLYIAMGWMILLAIVPLYQQLDPVAFWLLAAGGIVYSLGAIFYRFNFPFSHVYWHLFVLMAATLMWFSIYGYVG